MIKFNSVLVRKGKLSDNLILSSLENLQDAFVIVSPQWEYLYVNIKAASLIGKSQKELLGNNVWDLSPQLKKSSIYTMSAKTMKERKQRKIEYFFSGLNEWYEVNFYPVSSGMALVFHEIENRIKTENLLKQQSSLLDITHDAMIVLNEKNEILYWNKGAEKVYGWTEKESVGKIAYELLQTEYPQNRDVITSRLKKKEMWKGILGHTTKDGRKILVDSQWSIVSDSKEFTVLEVNRDITKAFEIEKNLHETKNQLEAVLQNAVDGILVQDSTGNILFANKPLLKVFGLSSVDEARKNKLLFYHEIFDFYDEKGKRFPFSQFPGRRAIRSGKRVKQTLRLVRKDIGNSLWVNISTVLVSDKHEGKPSLVVSIIRDITERRQTEESLTFLARAGEILSSSLNYEETLQHIAELAVPTIADWCTVEMLEGEHVRMVAVAHKNPKKVAWARRLREKNPVDMSQNSGLPKVLKTGAVEFYPVITEDMIKAAAKTSEELDLIKKIGFSSVIVVPMKIKKKVIGAIQLVSTESKRNFTNADVNMALHLASRASSSIENSLLYSNLQQEQARVNDVISNVPGVVWEAYAAWDKKNKRNVFKPAFVSKYAETMFGYSVKEWFDDTSFWSQLIFPQDFKRVQKELDVMYKSRKEGIIECRCVTKDGRIIWIDWHSSPIVDDKGVVVGLRGVASDITKQKELEQRKDDFVSMASHELKTPLTSSKVFAQILQRRFEKTEDTESQKFISRMNEQIDKLSNLVKDLLDVTRIQQQKMPLKKEKFCIKDLTEELVENIQPSTDHALHVDVSDKIELVADKERIRQVLTNFITNAIKYSPPDKKIIISSERKDGHVTLSVKDFGIGIPKDQQDKVFDRFFQATHTTSAQSTYPGLGLGLYISAEIIKMHNGKIGVESAPGKGSTFYFSLPAES